MSELTLKQQGNSPRKWTVKKSKCGKYKYRVRMTGNQLEVQEWCPAGGGWQKSEIAAKGKQYEIK